MSETTVQSPLHRVARRWLRAAGAALAAFVLVTCSSDSPVGPGRRGIGSVRVAPAFDAFARVAPLTLDGVRVIVVRPPAETLAVVPKPFNPTSTQLQLNIPVFLQSVSEDLLVTLELYSGQTLLFSGTRTLRVTQGAATPPDSIPVAYQGPGSQVAALVITPRDTTISFGAQLPYTVSATDAQAAPVAQYYVSWSTPGAPTGTTIDASGRLTAPSARDTFYVKAVTPNGVIDSTSVIVAASPSALVKQSGDGQSGIIGARLAQPLVVRVDGSDGLPVAGVPVTFAAALGGGSVDSATFISDGAGLATMGVTLGATVGAQSFTASAPGLATVTFTATGSGGSVKTWAGTVSPAWTTAGNWSPAAVPGAGDSVIIPAGTPNSPSLSGNAGIGALAILGNASNLTVAGNLTVARGITLADTNDFIQLSSGQLNAGTVTLAGFQAFIDASAGGISVSGATTISGDRAFVDASGISNSFGATIISGSAAFLQHGGGTSGAVTLTSSAFWEATGPVVVTGAPALSVQGTASVSTTGGGPAPVQFNGDVLLGGLDGRLIPNTPDAGFTINGNLILTGSGRLEMLQSTDTVRVTGNASFGGADETGSLTAGALFVAGNLTQTGVATSFVGSGSHTVFLNGIGAQTLNFASPGFAASRFQNVIIANSAGGVTASSDVYATGTAGVTPTAVRTLSGNGSTLFTTILNVSNFTFNNLLLNFAGSTVVTFDTVTFQGYAPTATPLTITHPGAGSALPFQDITFAVTPTTGFYIDATDSNPSDGVPLVIDMLNPTPATDGGFVQLAGGATINWPPAAPVKTWAGTISTDWSDPGNWTPAGVPGALDDVSIVPATNQPTLTANGVAHNLTIAGAGARVTVGGHSLTVGGNLITHTDGLLVMTNAADLVVVQGNAAFQGGDETGLLSAGELRLTGDFTQQDQTNTHSFFASGTHRTVMNGAALQGVQFCCTAGASGFQELDISNTVGINIQFSGNGVFVYDTLIAQVGTGPAPWLYMLGSPLRAARLRVDKLLVDRGTLTLNEGGVAANQQFDNVTFQNYLTSQTQLAIVAPGGASVPRTLTFNNLTFQPLNTGDTGHYLSVTAPSGTLIVDLPGAIPAGGNGPAFTTTSGAVTVNWPSGAAPGTWTGVVDTSWNTAGNWSDGNVPTATTDVTIPAGTPFAPATSGTVRQVRNLTVQSGATLAMGGGGLSVNGSLDAPGLITGNVASFVLAGTGTARGNVSGTFFSTTVNGSYSLNGRLVTPGLTINGTLTLAGNTAVVGSTAGDDFQTVNNGTLVMTNPLDSLLVGGTGPSVTFDGGSTVGKLTAGVILVNSTGVAGFTQDNTFNDSSYAPSGSHKLVTSATSTMLLSMTTPGTGSHFNILDLSAQTGGVTLQTAIRVNGLLISTPASTAPAINGSNRTITAAGGTQITGLTLTNTPFLMSGGASLQFDNVTFQSMSSAATQLAIDNVGATPLTFNNLTFSTVPTSGVYVAANDPDGATSGVLTVNLVNPTPATSGGFITQSGGAVINWPPSGSLVWTGAVSTDWNTAGNWSTSTVPTGVDDVTVPSAPVNQPSVSTSCSARNLTVNAGATLSLGAVNCQVAGDVFADGSITGSAALLLAATSQLRGNVPSLIVSGTVSVAGTTAIAGGLTISNGGFNVLGHKVTVAGALSTQGSGLLAMVNATDSVLVAGAGTFGGGDESAILTAGYLKIGGSFGQSSANSPASFAASGTHRTEIGAGGVRVINFASPGAGAGTSHFNDLIVSGATGGINIAANTFVNGQLISHPTGATPVIGIVAAVKVLTVGGVDVSRLGIDQNVMTIGGGVITQFDTVSFTGQANAVTQLTINNPGTAAPLTFNALSFGVAPTSGLYIAANDLDGASPNALTINVNGASPAAPSPTLFSFTNGALINWPGATPPKTWTGAQNSDWNTINNWSPAGIPTTSDDVVIPLVANQPSLSANGAARNLTVASGVVVLVNGFTIDITGDLVSNAANPFSGGGTLQLSGTVKSVSGALGVGITLNITDSYLLAGRTTAGSLLLNGNGNLVVNGQTIALAGTLNTSGNGVLTMTNAADSVIVGASANFGGGSETGLLSAGVLSVGNSITQGSGSAAGFDASGTHRTVLTGATPLVSIQSADTSAGSSHFQELVWAGGGTLSLATLTHVKGQLTVGAAGTINGGGFTNAIHVGNLVNTGLLTLFNAQLWIETTAPVPVALSNLTFTVGTGIVPLFIRHPGLPAAGALTLDQATFTNTPVIPAVYLDVDDANTTDGNLVTVNVTNATPASPGSQVNVANGAAVNWPFNANLHTWTGAADNSWENPLNWTGGGGPGITGDAVIPSGTPNTPQLGSNHQIGTLVVQPGAVLNLNGHVLTMNATVDASGQVTSGVAGGFLATFAGPFRGNFANISIEIGLSGTAAALNGLVSLAGTGTVFISGDVTMGGNVLLASQAVLKTTNGVGRLIMTSAGDVVTVDSTDWSGGNETGLLTAGGITTRAFSQGIGGTSDPASFVASGSHVVLLGGAAPATVSFANPATSHFQNVEFVGGTSTVTLATNVTAVGQLRAQTSGANGPTVTGTGVTLTAGGADVGANAGFTALTLDGVPVVLTGGVINSFGNLAFINQSPVGTALTVNNVGQALPYTFSNVAFTTALTAGGFHLVANDLDGATPDAFTIDMVGATPATGGGFFQANNGAVIHWPPASPATTWTGAVNTDWSVPGNWSTGSVPTASDDVVIPVATPTAAVTGACTAKSLLVNGTMDLSTNNCQVQGDVTANGFINSTGGRIQMQAAGQVRGNLPGLEVSAPVTVVGPLGLGAGSGDLIVTGAGASLTLNGNTVASPGSLTVQNGAVVVMTNPADLLSFTGTVVFDGGDETGLLTAGELSFAGNFSQGASTSPASFFASGNHLTRIGGLGNVGVSFATPGASRFQELDLSPMGNNAFTIGTDVTIAGQLTVIPTGTGPTINDLGSSTVTAGGAQIGSLGLSTALTMDGVPLVLSGGAITAFDHVTFTNQSPVGTALTVNNVGQATPYTFGNLTFTTFLTAGGFHIVANDLDDTAPFLTIDVIGANPATGGGFFQAINGAIINWPPVGSLVWTGAVSSDWSNPGNWDLGRVPTVVDDATVGIGTPNLPKLSVSTGINNLTIQSGAIVDLDTTVLVVGGNLDNSGNIIGVTGTAGMSIVGVGKTLKGSIGVDVALAGDYTLNGPASIYGLTVTGGSGSGTLVLNGNQLAVTTNFSTANNGTITMNNAADQLTVGGSAFWLGGDENGKLTDGVLQVAGDFAQFALSSTTSFAASGKHKTVLSSATAQTVDFGSPGLGAAGSHFQVLDLSGASGGVSLTVNSIADSVISTNAAAKLSSSGSSLTMRRAQITGLTADNTTLVLDEQGTPSAEKLSGISFQGFGTTGVTMLKIVGPGNSFAARPAVTTTNVNFQTLPIGAGNFYVDLTSTNSQAFSITMTGSNQSPQVGGNGPTLTKTTGGATVNWP